MTSHKLIVQERYGSLYRLHCCYEPPVLGPIEPWYLLNESAAWEFIINLRMDHADWLGILHTLDKISVNSRLSLYYSQHDIARLAHGQFPLITFYPLRQQIDFSGKDNHFPVIKAPQGVEYHFVPASVLLLSDPNPDDVKSFPNDWQQAQGFIKGLALTDAQLATITAGLELWIGPTRSDRIKSLVSAFAMGHIAVVRIHDSVTSPKSSDSEALPVEYYTPKRMILGPHDEAGYEPPPPVVVRYETSILDKAYQSENDQNNPDRWNDPFVCEYLEDDDARRNYEIGVKDGVLIHLGGPNAGKVLDTSDGATHWGGGGAAIFVMSEDGTIYVSKKHEPMVFHHSSFLAGGSVASAGELVVENGKLVEMSNKSGHYKLEKKLNEQLITELENKGISRIDLNSVIRSSV